jgi:hypothetical protein
MRVVPDQVGLDEIVSDALGLVEMAPGRLEDFLDQVVEGRMVDRHQRVS